jgi:hypothetical protein
MGTVTVDGNSYTIMGTLAGAKVYLATNTDPGAVAFRALTDNEMSRMLVASTKYLYRQPWSGTPTVAAPTQETAFPRDGLTNPLTGAALSVGTTPQNAIYAEYEMAAIIAGNRAAALLADSGSNVKLLKAGPVTLENFTATSAAMGTATPLPTPVMDLIGAYLGSNTTVTVGKVSGDSCDSSFTDCDTYNRVGPF